MAAPQPQSLLLAMVGLISKLVLLLPPREAFALALALAAAAMTNLVKFLVIAARPAEGFCSMRACTTVKRQQPLFLLAKDWSQERILVAWLRLSTQQIPQALAPSSATTTLRIVLESCFTHTISQGSTRATLGGA